MKKLDRKWLDDFAEKTKNLHDMPPAGKSKKTSKISKLIEEIFCFFASLFFKTKL